MIQRALFRLCLALALLVPIIMPATALAADSGISLTSSPVSMNLVIKPGTSATKTLQLENNGTAPVKINMQLDEFSAKGTHGQAIITEPSANDPARQWVSFSPSSFVAQPGVLNSVKMTIHLPRSAQLGYYFAAIFAPETSTTAGARQNVIKGSNGVLVLIDTQSGNEKRAVNVASFSSSKRLYEYLPASFTVTIHNRGNIYLAPFGNIYISHNADVTNTIAALNVNANAGNVLPKSNREFQATWSDGFPAYVNKTISGQLVQDKKGQPIQALKWDFTKANKFRFGKYYAKLTMIYNDGQRTIPLTSVISFWVIPWKLLTVGGIILLLLIGLIGMGLWSSGRRMGNVMHRSGNRSGRKKK